MPHFRTGGKAVHDAFQLGPLPLLAQDSYDIVIGVAWAWTTKGRSDF